MEVWLLLMFLPKIDSQPLTVPMLESEAECHRVAVQIQKLPDPSFRPGFSRWSRHSCIQYFVAGGNR